MNDLRPNTPFGDIRKDGLSWCSTATKWWMLTIVKSVGILHFDRVMQQKHLLLPMLGALPLFLASQSHAALIFQDTYTTADSLDSRSGRAAPSTRQSYGPESYVPATGPAGVTTQATGIGILTPTYSPSQPTDSHDQIRSGQLVLTGDAAVPISATSTQGIATLSPFYNFDQLDTLGNATTKVAFSLDVFSNSPGAGPDSYSHAAFTVGSLGTNGLNGRAESGTAGAGFSVRFVEDRNGVGQNGAFLQFFDGGGLPVQNLLANPAGFGVMNVVLDISDTDGNPWDGIGATTITVSVNGIAVGTPFTKGAGGYTDNFMTMEGSANFVGFGAAEHSFDNLQVFSIPEPTAALLGSISLLGLLRRRRH